MHLEAGCHNLSSRLIARTFVQMCLWNKNGINVRNMAHICIYSYAPITNDLFNDSCSPSPSFLPLSLLLFYLFFFLFPFQSPLCLLVPPCTSLCLSVPLSGASVLRHFMATCLEVGGGFG